VGDTGLVGLVGRAGTREMGEACVWEPGSVRVRARVSRPVGPLGLGDGSLVHHPR
jgi:hypothetical protein